MAETLQEVSRNVEGTAENDENGALDGKNGAGFSGGDAALDEPRVEAALFPLLDLGQALRNLVLLSELPNPSIQQLQDEERLRVELGPRVPALEMPMRDTSRHFDFLQALIEKWPLTRIEKEVAEDGRQEVADLVAISRLCILSSRYESERHSSLFQSYEQLFQENEQLVDTMHGYLQQAGVSTLNAWLLKTEQLQSEVSDLKKKVESESKRSQYRLELMMKQQQAGSRLSASFVSPHGSATSQRVMLDQDRQDEAPRGYGSPPPALAGFSHTGNPTSFSPPLHLAQPIEAPMNFPNDIRPEPMRPEREVVNERPSMGLDLSSSRFSAPNMSDSLQLTLVQTLEQLRLANHGLPPLKQFAGDPESGVGAWTEFFRQFEMRHLANTSQEKAYFLPGYLRDSALSRLRTLPETVNRDDYESVKKWLLDSLKPMSAATSTRLRRELKEFNRPPGLDLATYFMKLEEKARRAYPAGDFSREARETAMADVILCQCKSNFLAHLVSTEMERAVESGVSSYQAAKVCLLKQEEQTKTIGNPFEFGSESKSEARSVETTGRLRGSRGDGRGDIQDEGPGNSTARVDVSDQNNSSSEFPRPASRPQGQNRFQNRGRWNRGPGPRIQSSPVQTDAEVVRTQAVKGSHKAFSRVKKSRQEHLQDLLLELKSPLKELVISTSKRREPFCPATVAGEETTALIDSGSYMSLLPLSVLNRIHEKNKSLLEKVYEPPDQICLYDVSGRPAQTLGYAKLEVSLDGETKEMVKFAIAAFPLEHVILGAELLRGRLDTSPIAIRLAQYLLEESPEEEEKNSSGPHVIGSLSTEEREEPSQPPASIAFQHLAVATAEEAEEPPSSPPPFPSRSRPHLFLFLVLPPLAVLIHSGCDINLLINIILFILGLIPGIIHAIYVCFYYQPAGTAQNRRY